MNKLKVPSDIEKLINDAAQVAALAAVRQCLSEQDRKNRNFAFKKTKLLLSNYQDLKKHVSHAKDNALDIEEAEDDLIDTEETVNNDYSIDMLDLEPDIYIDSIRRSRCRTIIMIAHIDTCLKLLSHKATREGNYDKYRALKKVYFQGEEFVDVANEFFCSEATARRWVNDMISQLSVFLFGESGIQLR
jgi:hypothetical protein